MNNAARVVPPAPQSHVRSVPATIHEKILAARARLLAAAANGTRVRVYDVALDMDMSEFYFARRFREAFGCSPHVFYDTARAQAATGLLRDGLPAGTVARRLGLPRPSVLRALIARRGTP